VHTRFWRGNLRKNDHLEDLGTNWRRTLKWIFKKWEGGMDWIDMAQDRACRKLLQMQYSSIKCGEFLD